MPTPHLPPPRAYKKPEQDKVKILMAALVEFREPREYLKGRGILSGEIFKHFKLGYDKDRQAIAIPYFEGGVLVNIKYRKPPKEFFKEQDCKSSLYNIDHIAYSEPIIVTEGEFDAISCWHYGFKNVVSLPDGASAIACAEELKKSTSEILIATDNDEKGDDAANRIARLVGAYRCRRVLLPKKDFNDCLTSGIEKDEIAVCFINAEPCQSQLRTIQDSEKDLLRKISARPKAAVETGWESLDALFGGIRMGEHTILTAETGIGKTTWALNLAERLVRAELKCLIMTAEVSHERITAKLYTIHSGKYFYTLGNADYIEKYPVYYHFRPEDLPECRSFYADNIYYYCPDEIPPLNELSEMISYVTAAWNIKFVLIDHLHFFLDVKRPDEEKFKVDQYSKGMARLAEKSDVHLMTICHPSKSIGKSERVHMNDLKGSSNIKQDSANVIDIYRNREDGETKTEVRIQKCRDESGREGTVNFDYEWRNLRYMERDTQ